jgi:hypothetical protein
MRSIFTLLLVLISMQLFSQDLQHTHFSADTAKKYHIKSATVIILYQNHKDSTKNDTGSVDIQRYDTDGKILTKDYRSMIDKNSYHYHTVYSYFPNNSFSEVTKYGSNKTSDSSFHFDANRFIQYEFLTNKTVIRHQLNDSLLIETRMTDKDTVVTEHHWKNKKTDHDFPDGGAGDYTGKEFHHNAASNTDTVDYFNSKGE